jgi:hypothetical protein
MLTLALLAGYSFSMWFIARIGDHLADFAAQGARSLANQVGQNRSTVGSGSFVQLALPEG